MTSPGRLTLAFVGIVVVPLLSVIVLLGWLAGREAARPPDTRSLVLLWAMVGAAALAAWTLAWALARRISRSFRGYVQELEVSRNELRKRLDRLGETLRASLDLDRMLDVVVETAMSTLGGRAAAFFMMAPSGKDLRLKVARGFEPPPVGMLRIGAGVAGRAAHGAPVLFPSGEEGAPERALAEPEADTAVAVPLLRGGRTLGVVAIYGRGAPVPFGERDVATLGSFAAHASVAIENVLLHEEAKRLSITDGLTGLWNRRYLKLLLGKEIDRAARFDRPLSVLVLDLDRFKGLNDTYGHLAGDEALVEVSGRLMEVLRSNIDTVARYGGEEFVVLLPETPPEGARVVAEKIRRAVGMRPFRLHGAAQSVRVTVSVGGSSFPGDGAEGDALLGAADAAMYRAKALGRDRVELSAEGMAVAEG